MRRETYALWILPAGQGRRQRASSWKMNSTEAAALGAIAIVPGTSEVREIAETEDEKRALYAAHPSAGRDRVKHAGPR